MNSSVFFGTLLKNDESKSHESDVVRQRGQDDFTCTTAPMLHINICKCSELEIAMLGYAMMNESSPKKKGRCTESAEHDNSMMNDGCVCDVQFAITDYCTVIGQRSWF